MSKLIHTLITLPIKNHHLEHLQALSEKLLITVHPSEAIEEIPQEILEPTQVLFTFSALPTPEQVPNLNWLQYYLAGVDDLMKSPLAQKEELQITSLSGANAASVAEHAIALITSLGRGLPSLYDLQIRNKWLTNRNEYQPRSLRGSTVGIVGYGSVGREIARLLRPFGVKLLVSKQNAMQPQDTGYIPVGLGDPDGELFDRMYPPQALRSMLKECDFIVITTPATVQTRGLISKNIVDALKPTAYLIDLSRGNVVDHDALIAALQEGRLAGAGLDVFPEEPLPSSHPLWEMPNVILTPHVAGTNPQYLETAIELFTINLGRYLNGETLLNLIDKEKGY